MVTLPCIAWTWRSRLFGKLPLALFKAAMASSTAEKIRLCMTSWAARGIVFPSFRRCDECRDEAI
jgi:hypothetical protein